MDKFAIFFFSVMATVELHYLGSFNTSATNTLKQFQMENISSFK